MATKKTTKSRASSKRSARANSNRSKKTRFERVLNCFKPEQMPLVMKMTGRALEGKTFDGDGCIALMRSIDEAQLQCFERRLCKRDYKVLVIFRNAVLDIAAVCKK